jgi:hypothetical protein
MPSSSSSSDYSRRHNPYNAFTPTPNAFHTGGHYNNGLNAPHISPMHSPLTFNTPHHGAHIPNYAAGMPPIGGGIGQHNMFGSMPNMQHMPHIPPLPAFVEKKLKPHKQYNKPYKQHKPYAPLKPLKKVPENATPEQKVAIDEENAKIKLENKPIEEHNKPIKVENDAIDVENRAIDKENETIEQENKAIDKENEAIKQENIVAHEQHKVQQAQQKAQITSIWENFFISNQNQLNQAMTSQMQAQQQLMHGLNQMVARSV